MSDGVLTLEATATIADVIELVAEHEVRHVPLVDDGKLIGVLSERDLRMIDGLIAVGIGQPQREENVLSSPATGLLGGRPITCSPDTQVDDVIDLLLRERIGAVVVVDEEQHPVGMVSTVDILAAARGRLG